MAALAGARNTPRLGEMLMVRECEVLTNIVIFKGALVVADGATGFLRPGRASTTDRVMGRADTGTSDRLDMTGKASGSEKLKVDVGVFRWNNSSAGDLIVQADKGKVVYIVDDQTVAKTDGTGTRVAAGVVELVDSTGVYVRTGL